VCAVSSAGHWGNISKGSRRPEEGRKEEQGGNGLPGRQADRRVGRWAGGKTGRQAIQGNARQGRWAGERTYIEKRRKKSGRVGG
jgi:hypothetical protein